jgi:predicted phosphodiesterase
MSDLHIELTTRDWDLPARADRPAYDVLVIAGDLMPRAERGVRWLLDRVDDHPIIFVLGNHEHFGGDIDRTFEKARAAAAGTNVHVLQDDAVIIGGGCKFIGSTLWTDFNLFGAPHLAMAAANVGMNDYKRIRKDMHARRLRPVDTQRRHFASRAFIANEIARPFDGRRVVVTHHGPDRLACKIGEEADILSSAYTSDWSPLPPADAWIYGHTHESADRLSGNTRIVSNAKGYGPLPPQMPVWDNPLFDVGLVIEI